MPGNTKSNNDRGSNADGQSNVHNDTNTVVDLTLTALESILNDKFTSLKSYILSAIQESMQVLKDEIVTLQQSFNFLSNEYDDLKKDNQEQKKLISEMQKENTKLTQKFSDITGKLQSMEQVSRSYNVEIQGVTEKKEENVVGIVKNIYEVTTGEMISDETIMSCRRVAKINPNSPRPRNILLTLPSPRHRDYMLSSTHRYNKAHKDDKLNSHAIGMSGEKAQIFVVEHLPAETKALQAEARKLAKEKDYTFVWVKYGKIFVRKRENTKAIMLKNEFSLKLIV